MATKLPHSFSDQPLSIRRGKFKHSGDRLTVKGGAVFFGSIALLVLALIYFFVVIAPGVVEDLASILQLKD